MNDDFAPRPKCRCAVPWAIAFGLLALAGFMGGSAIWFKIGCDVYEKEIVNNARQIIDQQATIDKQERIIAAWVEANPPTDGELEPGAMGARIIPETKETIARVQELLEKFDRLLEDVKAGRVGVEIDGSLWKGHAEGKLKRNP